jgi:hypothetical protein
VQQAVEAHVDLGLARGAHLVVVDLDLDAEPFEGEDHLGPQVLEVIHGRDREVTLLVTGLVPEVGVLLAPGVPSRFDRLDVVVALVLVLVEAHVVEHEELRLWPHVARVGNAGRPQVLLGLAGHVARVAAVGLARDGIVHEAVEVQRLVLGEGIDDRGVGIGDQDHV